MDIKIVNSRATVSPHMTEIMTKEEIENWLNHTLVRNLVAYILDNQDIIPMKIDANDNSYTREREYIASFNVISDDEIKRLRTIEQLYLEIIKSP